MPKPQPQPKWFLPLLLTMLVFAAFISLPLFQETRINIEISGNIITNASVDTPRVPLISFLIHPSYGVGIYTINVTIVQTNENFTVQNIPSGQYTIIWQNGIPTHGLYTIDIRLFIGNTLENEYPLDITF